MNFEKHSNGQDDRLRWSDVLVILLPLVVFSVLFIGFWLWFRFEPARHPFNDLLLRVKSPSGKYVVEEYAFGDDDDAFSEWTVFSLTDPARDVVKWNDPQMDGARWKDDHTLQFFMAGHSDLDGNVPRRWHDVRFVFAENSVMPARKVDHSH